MAKSLKTATALGCAIFLFLCVPALQTMAAPKIALAWTPWSCYPLPSKNVPGGTMRAQGCTQWTDDNSFLWATSADTWGPKAYGIYTYVDGYDRCYSSDPWTWRMSSNNSFYNATYGNSGRAQGYYFDCGQGANHSYQNWSEHYWQQTSNSGLYIIDGAIYY